MRAFEAQEDAIVTICFPTYNRGSILLPKIMKILPLLDGKWPVLVMDNHSEEHKGDYEEIARLSLKYEHLHYFKQDRNRLFEGNLLSAFDLIPTKFAMIVSDEDWPNFDFIKKYYQFLMDNQEIALLRTSVAPAQGIQPKNSHIFDTNVYEPSANAISKFSTIGNYVSGQIYNLELLNKIGIPRDLEAHMHAQRDYPHLYLNVRAAGAAITMTTSEIGVFEGAMVEDENDASRATVNAYHGAYSFGSRLDQFVALRDAILEAFQKLPGEVFDASGFVRAYLELYAKFQFLICLANGPVYRNSQIDVEALARCFSLFTIGNVNHLQFFEEFKSYIIENIEKHEMQMVHRFKQLN